MILAVRDKIHVIHRQLFDHAARRHFIGAVEAGEGTLVKVTGSFFCDGYEEE